MRRLNFNVCFELLMADGSTSTCCHENFNKNKVANPLDRLKSYASEYGVLVNNSAYNYRKSKSFAIQNKQVAIDKIKSSYASNKLYPIESIAEIHLKITRTDERPRFN